MWKNIKNLFDKAFKKPVENQKEASFQATSTPPKKQRATESKKKKTKTKAPTEDDSVIKRLKK